MIREVQFYTGAFPADKGNALSSVLDFRLHDGNMETNNFKATLGTSEMALTADGHIVDKVNYLVSVRQSYLQLLFKMLELPFLPRFTDAQFKVKARFSPTDELTVLGVGGIDRMKLNLDITGEDAEYILSYLPTIEQETYTLEALYRHYAGRHVQTFSLSHNYLNDRNLKYRDNDESSEDNLRLRLTSREQKTTLRFENKSYLDAWTVKAGAEYTYSSYMNRSYQRLFDTKSRTSDYHSTLGFGGWGVFASAEYRKGRWTAAAALRSEGHAYSTAMKQMYRHLSPRGSVSYQLTEELAVAGSAGLYYQLPPYTPWATGTTTATWSTENWPT